MVRCGWPAVPGARHEDVRGEHAEGLEAPLAFLRSGALAERVAGQGGENADGGEVKIVIKIVIVEHLRNGAEQVVAVGSPVEREEKFGAAAMRVQNSVLPMRA